MAAKPRPADTREALADDYAFRHFWFFCQQMWDVASPSAKCVWGRHMRVVCDEIQAILEESDRRRAIGEAILARHPNTDAGRDAAALDVEAELGHLPQLRLVLLIPPRHSKSTIVAKLLPAWRWLHRPQEQFLTLTAADTLIERDGMAVRDVVKSARYRAMQTRLVKSGRLPQGAKVPDGQAFGLRPDQFAKEKFSNTEGGGRAGHVLGAGYTGVDSDVTVIDDPHDIDDAMLGTPASRLRLMEEVRSTYKDKVQDRLNSKIWGVVILIMQRVHPKDLADYMIGQGATVVCLPSEYDPKHPNVYHKDWRKEPGEILEGIRHPRAVLERLRIESPHGYATKHGMRPTVEEGVRYRRDWFKQRFRPDVSNPDAADWSAYLHALAATMDEVTISVDAASKTGDRNDYTSMGVWGRKGARRTLFARVYRRMEFPALKIAFEALCVEWPEAALKLVEDKSNGTALISACRENIPGIVPVEPKGDKAARSTYSEACFEARNVWISDLPWADEYEENMVGFLAGGLHDDDVDMTSQVMKRWAEGVAPWLGAANREAISDIQRGWTAGDGVIRWDRKPPAKFDTPPTRIWAGIVPGWANGRPGAEGVAVLVNQRGRMVSLVETGSGGVDGFVSALVPECQYWDVIEARYAELPAGPAPQTATALARQGVRVAGKPLTGARRPPMPGQAGGGWTGKPAETAALWTAFLEMLDMGLVGVRDGATLSKLETIVEQDGAPRMPDGTPLTGRVLAFLLALSALRDWTAVNTEPDAPRVTFNPPVKTDAWSLEARRVGR